MIASALAHQGAPENSCDVRRIPRLPMRPLTMGHGGKTTDPAHGEERLRPGLRAGLGRQIRSLRPGWRPAHSCYGLPVTKERLKALIAEYGRTALGTYFGLFFLVLLGFAAAFSWGFGGADWLGAESVAGAGVLGAAYVATKATQPLRIFATIALTPLVARLVERLRPQTRQP